MPKFVVKNQISKRAVKLDDVPKSLAYDITHHSEDGVIRCKTRQEAEILQYYVGNWFGPTTVEEDV